MRAFTPLRLRASNDNAKTYKIARSQGLPAGLPMAPQLPRRRCGRMGSCHCPMPNLKAAARCRVPCVEGRGRERQPGVQL